MNVSKINAKPNLSNLLSKKSIQSNKTTKKTKPMYLSFLILRFNNSLEKINSSKNKNLIKSKSKKNNPKAIFLTSKLALKEKNPKITFSLRKRAKILIRKSKYTKITSSVKENKQHIKSNNQNKWFRFIEQPTFRRSNSMQENMKINNL